MQGQPNQLVLRKLGIDTQQEYIVFMRSDSSVCVSEGITSLMRVQISCRGKTIVATVNAVTGNILGPGEASLSNRAFEILGASDGDTIRVSHLSALDSMSLVRAKIYGRRLEQEHYDIIIQDIVHGYYSGVHLSAFIAGCVASKLDRGEVLGLTRAMLNAGQRMTWPGIVADKHCVGGIPGNRTTPIVVSIVAENGILIPKTSSRAITSPAGTADTMEVMAPVNLSLPEIRRVVEKFGGCIAWGGSAKLSPADDIFIRVERALDIDSESQMIASVLSKKAAVGATHVVLDIPVGETAKVRSEAEAKRLSDLFEDIGAAIGLTVQTVITDGSQPVGRGIGPALEARDVLCVLHNANDAPHDLKSKSILIAGQILEQCGKAIQGQGEEMALETLTSGRALSRFMNICEAQGGFREPRKAQFQHDIVSDRSGRITSVNNRKIARLAKLVGAPADPCAGIEFLAPAGTRISRGDLLFTLHADSRGQLEYALDYYARQEDFLQMSEGAP
ncbi:MAG TPA: thymidine phosphorylase family protein [Leptospiraceae bacterium]|jgi:thymidine phosphorylase|nr:thymidine phosphorylase family protein [Leptospirales bacterium]HMX55156.1 thymidine phosphorylase family protein [Leptospiraceae bacterium]HMY44099.1 thymidine phosphorylase family protein [Leptospiraceae bacterium]HNE21885.1 thymidine phosphorylase family protein [Leptospiraceae bacterium]HNJ32710.1 thymidine phosphorylase family protein [Leptospiraceae bacterium]